MVRIGSYTDAELRVLEKWEREQVRPGFQVWGARIRCQSFGITSWGRVTAVPEEAEREEMG